RGIATMDHPNSAQTRLRVVPAAPETPSMTRLVLVVAEANRAGRRAPAGADTADASRPRAKLTPTWAARGFRRAHRRLCTTFPPRTEDRNSSPAKGRRASRTARRLVGSRGRGERAVVAPTGVDEGGPDGEAP